MNIPESDLAGRSEIEALNILTEFGIISDNAVWWSDVGNVEEALNWLASHPNER